MKISNSNTSKTNRPKHRRDKVVSIWPKKTSGKHASNIEENGPAPAA